MKKVIAVVLCALMMFTVLPVFSFAAGQTEINADTTIEDANLFNTNGTTYINAVVTIPDGMDVTLSGGKRVIIQEKGSLIVLGTLTVAKNATLEIKGKIGYPERVSVLGSAPVTYTFRNIKATNLGTNLNSVVAGYSATGSSYADVEGNVDWSANLVAGGTFTAPLNSYVYIKTEFKQPEAGKTYDDAKLGVYADGVTVPYKQGVHMMQASSAASITYDAWSDSAFLYGYSVYVPSGAGYTVHSVAGETSASGAIKVPAGTDFRFRIEIDGDYDMSAYEIYFYEGYTYDLETGGTKVEDGSATLLTADSDGYYTIPAVYSDYTIYATGVVSNEAIETTSSILDLLRNVLKVFETIWQKLAAIFGFSIG